MDDRVQELVDAAVRHDGLTARTEIMTARTGLAASRDDLLYLLSFPEDAPEAKLMIEAARDIARKACGNRGFIHAQIGIDCLPCPENCRYCSFAIVNNNASREHSKLDLDDIAGYCRLFAEEGVHLISLMATAALPFDDLLSAVGAAREAIGTCRTILLVNGPDFSLDEACALKGAGANAAYHAIRLREGEITDISPDRRRETIDNIHAAGLALMSGVEPLWEDVTYEEIADAILEQPRLRPVWTGACRLCNADGTAMQDASPTIQDRVNQVGALIRLLVGNRIPIGGVGGVVWVDAGADPRARGYKDEADELRFKIAHAREELEHKGWDVPTQADAFAFCLASIKG